MVDISGVNVWHWWENYQGDWVVSFYDPYAFLHLWIIEDFNPHQLGVNLKYDNNTPG